MAGWWQGSLQEGKESQSQQAQLQAEAWDPGDALGRGVPASSCSVGTQVGNVALT